MRLFRADAPVPLLPLVFVVPTHTLRTRHGLLAPRVAGYGDEPGVQRSRLPWSLLERAHPGLLDDIVGGVVVPKEPPGNRPNSRLVSEDLVQAGKRTVVVRHHLRDTADRHFGNPYCRAVRLWVPNASRAAACGAGATVRPGRDLQESQQ